MENETKRPRRKLPSARQVTLKLWLGMETAVSLLDDADPAVRLKAAHALSAVGGQIIKGLEVADVQARLAAIEKALKDGGGQE